MLRAHRDGVLLAAFFASGAAALGYEILWTRLLSGSLGSETLGVLGTLAGFFGGLALGAVLFHTRARRSPDPVRLFVRLELAAAAWAASSPWLLTSVGRALPPLFGALAGDNDSAAGLLTSLVISGALLLPGTMCMGATLPALVEALRRRATPDDDRVGVGRLYAANTLGATAGVLFTLHVLLPGIGMIAAALVLSALGGLAALAASAWGRAAHLGAAPSPAGATGVVSTADPDPDVLAEPRVLHLVAFLTGLAGVGLEVAGVQVLAQILENTVYTFAATLAVFLVGTALGSALYTRVSIPVLVGRPATTLAVMLLGLALSTVPAAEAAASASAVLHALAPEGASFARHLVAELGACATVFLLPCALMGATFAHLFALLAAGGTGRAYALNTVGSALAPFVFGVWAAPALGYTDAFYLVAWTYLLAFGAFTWARRFPTLWHIGGIGVVVGATALGPRDLVLVDSDPEWKVVERRETAMGLVMVSEHVREQASTASAPPLRRLQVGRHFRMGGAPAFGERRMGHIPLLLHPGAKAALFLGVGTGATLGAARHHPLTSVTAVELVPAVAQMFHWFADINEKIHEDPRVTLHVADARRWLAAAGERWDVIEGDLFHPAIDGAGSLYSLEHFEAARDHLAPGGIFAQWLPLHQIEPDTLRTIVRTFLAAFPDVHSFLGIYNVQTPAIVLVGRAPSDDAWQLDADALVQALRAPVFDGLLMSDPRDLLGAYMLDRAALAAFAGEGPVDTVLAPRIIFDAPRAAYLDAADLPWRSLETLLPLRTPLPSGFLRASGDEATRKKKLDRLERGTAAFSEALGAYLTGELARVRAGTDGAVPRAALREYLRAYAAAPEFAPARGMLYQSAARSRAAAEFVYPELVRITPRDRRAWAAYLGWLERLGDVDRLAAARAEAERRLGGGKPDTPPAAHLPEAPPPT